VVWPKRVVVEKEKGGKSARSSLPVPDRKGIFGSNHLVAATKPNERLVLRDTSLGVPSVAPELVVSRNPDDAREKPARGIECKLEMFRCLADVAAQYEPVVGMGGEGRERLPVLPKPEM
jgi:hypothetical protein